MSSSMIYLPLMKADWDEFIGAFITLLSREISILESLELIRLIGWWLVISDFTWGFSLNNSHHVGTINAFQVGPTVKEVIPHWLNYLYFEFS